MSPSEMSHGQDEASQESLLLAHLERIDGVQSGFYAIHIHLSQLRSGNRKPHYLRIAARAFENLLNNFEATLFQFHSADFLLICREVPIEEVDPVIYKLRALFNEDPLTLGEEGSLDDRFTTWYDLSQGRDYSTLKEMAAELAEEDENRRTKKAEAKAAGEASAMQGEDLNPGNLAAINRNLEGVRIIDLIHQQTAVEVVPGGKGNVLFREHYVSMFDLQKRIAPDVNLFGSSWLFQFLTETLDHRVLAVVARWDFEEMKSPISLNLNVSTILAKEFQHFHNNVGANTSKVVVEIQMIDIFSDMGAFAYARDTLQGSGYKVLVDGLSPLSLQFFEPGLLGADFVKINWSREFLGEVPSDRIVEMGKVVEQTGKDKLILSRVDSEDAIKWGLSLGITRYQGRYIDKVVNAMVSKGVI
ncbi:MAG: hypothetical protein V3R66_00670 [Rhodospirillales bacterium]